MQSAVCSSVRRVPRRMVPPLCVRLPSGMNTTHGSGVAWPGARELVNGLVTSDAGPASQNYSRCVFCVGCQIKPACLYKISSKLTCYNTNCSPLTLAGLLTEMKEKHLVELGAVGRLASQHVAGELDHRELRSRLGTQPACGRMWSKGAHRKSRCKASQAVNLTLQDSCTSLEQCAQAVTTRTGAAFSKTVPSRPVSRWEQSAVLVALHNADTPELTCMPRQIPRKGFFCVRA